MEVQELIFADHPGMTDHLRTINKLSYFHIVMTKKIIQFVHFVISFILYILVMLFCYSHYMLALYRIGIEYIIRLEIKIIVLTISFVINWKYNNSHSHLFCY